MRAKALILSLIACLTLVLAGAQTGPPSHSILSDPNRFADAHVNGMDAQLHLSEEQKAKLRPLFVAEGKALMRILSDSSLSQEQRQQKIRELHEQTRDKVIPILTPSQLEQFKNPPRMPPPQRTQKGARQT